MFIKESIETMPFTQEFDPERLKTYFENLLNEAMTEERKDELRLIIESLNEYIIVLGHQEVARVQRESYNFQRKSKEILRNNLLIEMDFKQKIAIGLSPEQANREFYKQELKSCLGKVFP